MLIEIDNLHVCFGDRVVFSGLSLTLDAGKSTAIVAPSGYGKSTLLSVIAGFLSPDSGTCRFITSDGSDGNMPSIDWIVQSSPMLPRRTAVENAALGSIARGDSHEEAFPRALAALSNLGLNELAHAKVNSLSGGERQRVAVARAMTSRSDVLLADEPTASLDASSRRAVSEALSVAAKNGTTVIVATHDTSVAERCDTVIELDKLSADE